MTTHINKKGKIVFYIFLAFLVVCILGFIMYNPCPSSSQYIIFRIVLSIALGAMASMIPGFLYLNLNNGIRATGALAIVVLTYFFTPKIIKGGSKCNDSFSVTIFLKDDMGRISLKEMGDLTMRVSDFSRTKSISEEGSCTFAQIPYNYFEKKATVYIENVNWEFENGKKETEFILNRESQDLIVRRDNSWCCVHGFVRNYDMFLSGVLVRIGNYSSLTDSNGRFSISIPYEEQKEEYKLIIQKDGYKIYEKLVSPLGPDCEILLEK